MQIRVETEACRTCCPCNERARVKEKEITTEDRVSPDEEVADETRVVVARALVSSTSDAMRVRGYDLQNKWTGDVSQQGDEKHVELTCV